MRRRLCVVRGVQSFHQTRIWVRLGRHEVEKSEVKSSQVDGDLNGTFWRRNGEAKPKKFLSISFRLATEGWGEETREKCKEIFWFLHTRVCERVRGAFHSITTSVERTQKYKATTRSARATSLVLEVGSDLVQ